MSNVVADIKSLLENPLLIYGAGKGAFRLIINLKELNADIIGLVVSDISDSRTLGFDGFKVQTPDAYKEYKDSAVVLIATSPKYHDEIKANCMRLGFKNTVLYTNDLIKELSLMSHKRLFIRNNLPLDTEIISIGNGKYLNPFSELFPQKFGIIDQSVLLKFLIVMLCWILARALVMFRFMLFQKVPRLMLLSQAPKTIL